ncbi:MAG: hypothetical protein K2K60_00210 [Clostridia bacterium]|nr:hypothetical protein [Clostridia bacterium]
MNTMVTQTVPIGAKKPRSVWGTLFALFFMLSLMGMVMSWFFWKGARDGDYMLVHGTEVQATITGYEMDFDTVEYEGSSETVVGWRNTFVYKDKSGREYPGVTEMWTREQDAKDQVDKTITVVIDLESGKYKLGSKDKLKSTYSSNTLYKLSVSLTVVFFVSLVIFGIGVYRTQIHKGICRKIGGQNSSAFLDENYLITGEVVAAFGLLWYYVRVKYRDENGKEHIRWANSRFTHKEANFLREKRFVRIATYYNALDIVEQMPVTKMVKTK